MTNIHKYIADTIALANSIIFKFEHVDIYINRNLERDYGLPTPINKQDSKYYLNLYGLPHSTDRDISVYIPDINEIGNITKSNIGNYPILQNELLNKTDTYHNLLTTYNKENTLIKGMLNPIVPDIAMNAKDGEILYYDSKYVTSNEDSLIFEIGEYIRAYISSYYNKRYNIDNYYLPGVISVIYNTLPVQILKIRMGNIFTTRVDDFHLYTYLEGYKNLLKDDLSFLPKDTILWLYGNIRYLDKHIGHNSTIDTLFHKIYDKVNVGVQEVTINNSLPTIGTDIMDISGSMYTKDKHLVLNKANTSSKTTDKVYTLDDILTLELDLKKLNNTDYETIYNNNTNNIKTINKTSKSKVFMFDEMDVRILYNTTILNLIFNNIIYYVTTDKFTIEYDFLNPSDNVYYKLNKHSVKYIIIASLFMMQGKDISTVNIDDYKIEGILNRNILVEDIIKNTILKDKLRPIVNDIIDMTKSIPEPVDYKGFTDQVNLLRKIYSKIWYYITNTNDIIISSDLKIVFNNILKEITVPEDNSKTLNELLTQHTGDSFYIAPNLANVTITKLCKDIFDLDVDEYVNIEDTYNKYIKLAEKFTSYTVQFLYDTTYLKTLFTYNTGVLIGQQQQTVGNVYGAYFRRNNNVNMVISSIYNPFREQLSVFDTLTPDSVHTVGDTKVLSNVEDIVNVNSVFNINIHINALKMTSNNVNINIPTDVSNIDINALLALNVNTINDSYIYAKEDSMLTDILVYSDYGSYEIMKTEYTHSVALVEANVIYTNILDSVTAYTDSTSSIVSNVNDIIDSTDVITSGLTVADKISGEIEYINGMTDTSEVYLNILENIDINTINDVALLEVNSVSILEDIVVNSNYTGYTVLGTMYDTTDTVIDVNSIYINILDSVTAYTDSTTSIVSNVNDIIDSTDSSIANDSGISKIDSDVSTISIADIESIYDNISQELYLSTVSNGDIVIDTLEDDVLLNIDTGMMVDTN